MNDKEGVFNLVAVVGQNIKAPGLWNAAGYVHAPGETEYLEQVHAGSEFSTRTLAVEAGIEAARAVARTLDPNDSRARRADEFRAKA